MNTKKTRASNDSDEIIKQPLKRRIKWMNSTNQPDKCFTLIRITYHVLIDIILFLRVFAHFVAVMKKVKF